MPKPCAIYDWNYRLKLDGVGPNDNRPSTDKLHHLIKQTKNKNKKNCHM